MNEPEIKILELLQARDFPDCTSVKQFKGGANNRVFRAESPGEPLLVKEYFSHPSDKRDRFATERAFYDVTSEISGASIPRDLAWYPDTNTAVFEFIEGQRPDRVTPQILQKALAFFNDINSVRFGESARELPTASEACFSVEEHLRRIEHRVDRLSGLQENDDLSRQAAVFVETEIIPVWMKISGGIRSAFSLQQISAELGAAERCISPSDFGFHNSLLRTDGSIKFLDFEYAGWDDPAKMVCDFFCQPAVPVPEGGLDDFLVAMETGNSWPGLRLRVQALRPAYGLKWCCIMLNEFLPADSRRRAFSNPGDDALARKRNQLAKVEYSLHHIRS